MRLAAGSKIDNAANLMIDRVEVWPGSGLTG